MEGQSASQDIYDCTLQNGNVNTILWMVPKYRRKKVYGKLRADIGKILGKLCYLYKCKKETPNPKCGWRFLLCAFRRCWYYPLLGLVIHATSFGRGIDHCRAGNSPFTVG